MGGPPFASVYNSLIYASKYHGYIQCCVALVANHLSGINIFNESWKPQSAHIAEGGVIVNNKEIVIEWTWLHGILAYGNTSAEKGTAELVVKITEELIRSVNWKESDLEVQKGLESFVKEKTGMDEVQLKGRITTFLENPYRESLYSLFNYPGQARTEIEKNQKGVVKPTRVTK